jgi:hypothetical protein
MSVIADRLAPEEASGQTPRATGRAMTLDMEQVSGAEWDRIAAGFDEICQEQLHAFAATRWPLVQPEPMVFSVDGAVVGGALMMVQRLPLGLGRIAICKWGPMLADTNRPDAEAVYAGMVEALMAEYAERRGHMLSVLPRASVAPVNRDYAQLLERGFKRGSVLGFPNRYIVNLRLGDAEQRRSFSQTWRRQLTKAEKAELSFERAGPDQFESFTRLYTEMTDRKQFSDHSAYETLPEMMAITVPALRPDLFLVRHRGAVVAGALIFSAGERAVYLYGATNGRALQLRAGYFLHWHIIRWLRDHSSANWYDLGGTDGFQGLHQFKKGMVGEAGVIRPVPPVANYASSRLAYLLGSGAFAARDAVNGLRRVLDGWRNPKSRPNQARTDGGARP